MSEDSALEELKREVSKLRGITAENSVHVKLLVEQSAATQKLLGNLAVTQQELKALHRTVLENEREVRQVREQLIAADLLTLSRKVNDLENDRVTRIGRTTLVEATLKNLPVLIAILLFSLWAGTTYLNMKSLPPPTPAYKPTLNPTPDRGGP